MSNEELLAEIKTRGYWRIEIRPTEYKGERLASRSAMHDLLSRAMVSLRGWPYPHFRAEETTYSGKWLEGQTSWSYYREWWRLYTSGQWLNYLGLRGAWITRERLFEGLSPLPPQHNGYLHVRGDILFTLTEILHFAVGLAQAGTLQPTAFLSIQLHNTGNYMLFESFERLFPNEYVNKSNIPIERQVSVPVGQLAAVADQIALEMAIKVFEVFGWIPSEAVKRMLVEDQKKLIERRL
jgi:hypothetical protein